MSICTYMYHWNVQQKDPLCAASCVTKNISPRFSRTISYRDANSVIFVSKAIHYFIPSLVAIVRGIKSLMRIGFLYYNCLGFGLVLWLQDDFIPNNV